MFVAHKSIHICPCFKILNNIYQIITIFAMNYYFKTKKHEVL